MKSRLECEMRKVLASEMQGFLRKTLVWRMFEILLTLPRELPTHVARRGS